MREVERKDQAWGRDYMASHWAAEYVVVHGSTYYPSELFGFIAEVGGQKAGLVTYTISGDSCEIVTIHSETEGLGVGSMLLSVVKQVAATARCRKIWLRTTNDNLAAIRFYRKRGFRTVAVHRDAVERSRRRKPMIPTIGADGIPIRDEIELECQLPRVCSHDVARQVVQTDSAASRFVIALRTACRELASSARTAKDSVT